MLKYTLQRILLMLMTLLIITCMCFVLVRMLPPVQLPAEDPHTKVILARREAMGYNKPYLVQFGIFLKDIFQMMYLFFLKDILQAKSSELIQYLK